MSRVNDEEQHLRAQHVPFLLVLSLYQHKMEKVSRGKVPASGALTANDVKASTEAKTTTKKEKRNATHMRIPPSYYKCQSAMWSYEMILKSALPHCFSLESHPFFFFFFAVAAYLFCLLAAVVFVMRSCINSSKRKSAFVVVVESELLMLICKHNHHFFF